MLRRREFDLVLARLERLLEFARPASSPPAFDRKRRAAGQNEPMRASAPGIGADIGAVLIGTPCADCAINN